MRIIKEEGLKERAARHRKNADAIVKALESIGFKTLANADCRASTLTVAIYPEGVEPIFTCLKYLKPVRFVQFAHIFH